MSSSIDGGGTGLIAVEAFAELEDRSSAQSVAHVACSALRADGEKP